MKKYYGVLILQLLLGQMIQIYHKNDIDFHRVQLVSQEDSCFLKTLLASVVLIMGFIVNLLWIK